MVSNAHDAASDPANVTIPPPTPGLSQDSARCSRQQKYELEKWDKRRGRRYADCTLENFTCNCEAQRKAVATLRDFLSNSREHIFDSGANLLLYGPPGTGKDHLLAACIRDVIRRGLQIHGVNFHAKPGKLSLCWSTGCDLMAEFRKEFADHTAANAIRNCSLCRLLAISDPVLGELTDYQASNFYRVLDHRYNHQLPTWVTVNVANKAELEERMTPQIADRLRDGAVAIHCNWESYRGTRA